MNRLNLILFLVLLSFTSCKIKENIALEELETSHPIILRLTKKSNKIRLIHFPNKVKVTNSSLKSQGFTRVGYYYNNTKGNSTYLYTENNNKLNEIDISKFKEIYPYQSKEYIVYSSHLLYEADTITIDKTLERYRKKMMDSNVDTLAISLKEFKNETNGFVKRLTKNDTLQFNFIIEEDNKRKRRIYKIPIEF